MSTVKAQDPVGRSRLADIIHRRSFGRAKVLLASGRESDFYFDMKPSMLDPEGASLMADGLLAMLADSDAEYVGGLEMGAVPITGAVCLRSHAIGRPLRGLFVRKKPKEHGAKKLVEGLARGETLAGRRVAVIEDVTTTGESALKAVRALREDGAQVVLVATVVDREEGATALFAQEGVPFAALFRASEFLARP
jgi:orotate phosphoribosyltransferase